MACFLAGHRLRGVAREGTAKLEVALPSSLFLVCNREERELVAVPKVVRSRRSAQADERRGVVDAKGKVLAQQQFANTARLGSGN